MSNVFSGIEISYFDEFFSRPTPIGGREIHIGLLREEEEGGRDEEGPLASSPGGGS